MLPSAPLLQKSTGTGTKQPGLLLSQQGHRAAAFS